MKQDAWGWAIVRACARNARGFGKGTGVEKSQAFDGKDAVLIMIAHAVSLMNVMEF